MASLAFAIIPTQKLANLTLPTWYSASVFVNIIITLISVAGIWKMKKWGLFLYIISIVISVVESVIIKTFPISLFGYIIPVIIIVYLFWKYKELK